MKTILCNKLLNKSLTALCAAVTMLSLSTGSVLAVEVSDEDYKLLQAYKQKEAEKQQPAHQTPHKAEPPTGGHANLGEAATNPIANLVQLQVNDSYSWENHNSSGYSNVSVIQSVVPFKLPWDKVPLLITRTTLPYVTTPNLGSPINDRKRGFGDAELLLLATPKLKTKGVQVGIGVNAVFPTAGDNGFTGSGKWQIGPAFLYINMRTPKLQWGLFAFQDWSFASSSSGSGRSSVSKISLQPFITKHLDKGWYVGSPDSPQTYNWETKKWTWTLGPVVGRVFKIGKQPVKMFGAVYYNPEGDAGPTAEWTGKLGITFLFPK